MPLFRHKSGETVRVIPGRHEHKRLAADPDWEQVDQPPHAVDPDPGPALESAAPSKPPKPGR